MARHSLLGSMLRQMEREAIRQHRAHVVAARRYERAVERQTRALERQAVVDYVEQRRADTASLNEELAQCHTLLSAVLGFDTTVDLEECKRPFDPPVFDAQGLEWAEPDPMPLWPDPPGFFSYYLFPWVRQRYAIALADAEDRHNQDMTAHAQRERDRVTKLTQACAAHERAVTALRATIDEQHKQMDACKRLLAAGDPEILASYFSLVLMSNRYPALLEPFPRTEVVEYDASSRQLIVDCVLPPLAAIPAVHSYRYIKASDEIKASPLSATRHKALYLSVLAQITLRTLYWIFTADQTGHVEVIHVSGYIETFESTTGRPARICLVAVHVARALWGQLDLSRLDPVACLRMLNASVSNNPGEMEPAYPLLTQG